jgi:hypothetical protein
MPVTSGVLPRWLCLIRSPFFRSSNKISFTIFLSLELKSHPTLSFSRCQACCLELVACSFFLFSWPSWSYRCCSSLTNLTPDLTRYSRRHLIVRSGLKFGQARTP